MKVFSIHLPVTMADNPTQAGQRRSDLSACIIATPPSPTSGPGISGWIRYRRFAMAVGMVVIVWTVIMPWIASQPRMAEHLHELEAQGIDGGAMFYTELKAMEPILQKLESKTR